MFSRTFTLLLFLGLALVTFSTPASCQGFPMFIRGDVDQDGRVLINDPAHAIKNGNGLVHLGRRLNSYIEFRNVRKDLRTSTESFCIADGAALVYRKNASRWEGIADTWDPSVTKTYTARFDEIWHASEVEFEFRQLGM